MDDWKYKPAGDLGMTEKQRLRSVKRESGLFGAITHNCWWLLVRGYFRACQRVEVHGRENLPTETPFVLAANHASHLDALLLGSLLPTKLRNVVFPNSRRD